MTYPRIAAFIASVIMVVLVVGALAFLVFVVFPQGDKENWQMFGVLMISAYGGAQYEDFKRRFKEDQ